MPGAIGCTLNRRGPAELHGKSCTMLSPRPVPVPASLVVKNGSNACSKTSGVGPRDYDKAKKLVAEAGYKGEPVVLLDPADIPQLHAEAAVAADLLQKRLGLDVEVATTEWGTVIKRIYSKNPVAPGGWNVFVTASRPTTC